MLKFLKEKNKYGKLDFLNIDFNLDLILFINKFIGEIEYF